MRSLGGAPPASSAKVGSKSIVEHIYALPALTPTQGLRLRALLTEISGAKHFAGQGFSLLRGRSPRAARKALHVADDVASILAIEILAAARGLDIRRPLVPGKGVKAAYAFVRGRVPAREEDRMLAPEIETVRDIVLGEGLLAKVEEAVGPLTGIR